jgi:Holliday junction resolvasome RuvABC endonuclease subunit
MVRQQILRALGVDPGFANMGAAVVEQPMRGGKITIIALKVLETKKASRKVLSMFRVAGDDQRRLKEQWELLTGMLTVSGCTAVGVESYAPWPGQMGGNAWKVGLSYQVVCAAAWYIGVEPFVFMPSDLKREFCHDKKASKEQVGAALAAMVEGLRRALIGIPLRLREHATDAVGHAVLALLEQRRLRSMAGVR